MIAFLKKGELKPPQAVAAAPARDAVGVGFLTPGFEQGTFFLKNTKGDYFRLEWLKEERAPKSDSGTSAAPDRRRALPPGEYTLTTYRLIRRDDRDTEWFISATAPKVRRLVVRAGEEQVVKVDETVHLDCRVQANDEGIVIQAKITGEEGSGLSIYRSGKRIEIGYRLTDAQSKELATGTLDYG